MTGQAALTGADAVAAALEELDVKIVFGITGAGNLAICDAIHRRGATRLVFVHHEQAALMSAQGLSRTKGTLGVALVTTGGGSTNALTGVVGANMDSVPILVISGNESSVHAHPDNRLRIWGVQGFDSAAVFSPVAKATHRACGSDQIHGLIVHAARTALAPRCGVVTVDVPMDLQRKPLSVPGQAAPRGIGTAEASTAEASTTEASVTQASTAEPATDVDRRGTLDAAVETVWEALRHSARPVLLLGNGLRTGLGRAEIRAMVRAIGVPALLSWSAIDLLDSAHPMNFGRSGIYGDRSSNMIVQNADLVIAIGSRLAIPQMSYDPMDFARNASVIVVDVDPAELAKFVGDRWVPVCADAGLFLARLARLARLRRLDPRANDVGLWISRCSRLRLDFPRRAQTAEAVPRDRRDDFVSSYDFVYELSDQAGPTDIFVTDMGTGLLSGYYGLDVNDDQRLFTSLGLGEMGFGLPGAIGAQFAAPQASVICLNTDGGMMLNLQELQTIVHHRLPIKLVVFSNDGYLMIKHSQRNLFDGRYVGSNLESGVSCPDFAKVAEAFGLSYRKLFESSQIASSVREFLDMEGPVLLEVVMHPEQLFIPRVGTIKGDNGALISPPLEDMIPLISGVSLSAAMNGSLHPESIRIRSVPSSLPKQEGAP